MKRLPIVAAVSLVFTYLFFLEYLPPFSRVHIPYDLTGYHYPLTDYAFLALKEGRFPQWDAAIYCGQPFAGNIQAALFYPPTWLLFAVSWTQPHVSYQSLQEFVFAHVWLAFLLCYVWLLRGRGLTPLASALGAGVFAYGGYMLLQLQHLGQVAGLAWFPLGAWGIDQAIAEGRVRKLWKLAAASALMFLAGYPPLWFVFAVCMTTYVVCRNWKWTPAVAGVLLFSICLAAVQFLPSWDARGLKIPEQKYGSGIKELIYFVSYLVPNYFNFGMNVPVETNLRKEYLYLGAPGIAGLLLVLRRRNLKQALPFAAVLVVSLLVLINPSDLVWSIVKQSTLLSDLCRSWNFLAGIAFASAALAAIGLDDFLRRPGFLIPRWLSLAAIALTVAWAVWELRQRSIDFAFGWAAAVPPAIMLAIFLVGILALRSERGRVRTLLAAALLVGVAIDYQVFGTSKRFNATPESGELAHSITSFYAMDDAAYHDVQEHREYRVVFDLTGPFQTVVRHVGLRTPQGFDPFFTTQYREVLRDAPFRTAWEFDLPPGKDDLLQMLGVRYVVTSEAGPLYSRLVASPDFRKLGTSDHFYRVFEYRDARRPYGLENGAGSVQSLHWTPERRDLSVDSKNGGMVFLSEQLFPGWRATVDGQPAKLDRWRGAFQAVAVQAGSHMVRFEYSSHGLRLGVWISLVSIAGLLCYLWADARREKRLLTSDS